MQHDLIHDVSGENNSFNCFHPKKGLYPKRHQLSQFINGLCLTCCPPIASTTHITNIYIYVDILNNLITKQFRRKRIVYMYS